MPGLPPTPFPSLWLFHVESPLPQAEPVLQDPALSQQELPKALGGSPGAQTWALQAWGRQLGAEETLGGSGHH